DAGEAGLQTDATRYSYRIVEEYPHDPEAFTQGLVYCDGYLYEGTGRYGESSVRKVELVSGDVVQIHPLESNYFGEGITIFGEKLFQLTWNAGTGFIYDRSDFALLDTFRYPTEGWGLTHNDTHLIMSDGSATLYFLDPETLRITNKVTATYNGSPVHRLNELEYIRGAIYANVYQTEYIVRIDPVTGEVTGWIHLEGLTNLSDRSNSWEAVLNGIAYDAEGDRLFVTGKLWPALYQIELVPSP
ncbi:MAG TPA: glutaminyl-peptide cyclotransferase, partial [bacterium]|nr:glutaminyl-peptide cyclotransferase [bacterium]